MHKSYPTKPTRPTTTDGFIRPSLPLPLSRLPRRLMVVRKQRLQLISDTVIERQRADETRARLVFYSELAKQPQVRSTAYSLSDTPVGKDLSIELFANEIESRFQRGLDKELPIIHDTPVLAVPDVSRWHVLSQLSRAKHRFSR
jgi:hypothetical protein